MHYKKHAKEVVNRFKRMLEKEEADQISEDHYEELEMLISAAMGVVDSSCRHEMSSQVSLLAKDLKKQAQHVDSHYLDKED